MIERFKTEKVPKGNKILSELEFNAKQPQEDIFAPDGTITHRKHLFSVDSYSTRFLSSEDQLLLAIDKIAFPEFKSGLRPFHDFGEGENRFDIWNGLAFGSVFSLNDGDKNALTKLIQSFPHAMKERYVFTIDPDSIYAGTYDETSTFRSLSKEKKSPTAVRLEQDMFDLFRYLELHCFISDFSSNNIAFSFETYDRKNPINDNNDIPFFSAIFTYDKRENEKHYTVIRDWNYSIYVFSDEKTSNGMIVLPDDTNLKLHFETMKVMIRTALATLGVYPEKLIEMKNS